jgi:AsmA family protein
VESDEWRLRPFTVRLGRTAMKAELARVGIGAKPLVQASLAVENIDAQELQSLLPPPDPAAPKTSIIDLPILPKGIDLFDADVDVNCKRIDMRPAPVTAISFKGHIREGHMFPSPFGATIAGVTFAGAIGVDLRSDVPEASMWVAAEKVDVGTLLKQLEVAQDVDARFELLRAEMVMRGSRVGEMLGRSSVIVEMESGQLTVHDPNRTLELPIQLAKGVARVSPGNPLAVDLDGTIDVTPVAIRIAGAELPDILKTGSRVPFRLTFEAASTRLELNGKVTLPIQQREIDLDLNVTGERLDTLDRLTRVQLPRWGPWSVGGRFRVSKSGYVVDDLALRVGQSTLNGHGGLVTTGVRPKIDMQLAAPRVQLDDFKLEGWSLFEKKEKKPEKSPSVEEMRAKAKDAAAQGQKLLSPEVMRQLDATLDVDVTEVLSGQDRLGSGALHAQLADGKFVLAPAEVNTAGGSAQIAFTYQPTETDVAVQASIRTERFDYGILARRIKPDTDIQGLLSLQMEISARAPSLDALMQHADGRIDFAVWPKNFKSGIFDLWAVNLLAALVPAVDPSSQSVVNCAIARFDLHDGTLKQDKILMDTSRMRVHGQGMVDFNTEVLALRLVPTAKTPQFFSLATPIGVSGTITDFKIGVSGSDVAETVGRLFSSVVVVPVESLFGRKLPRDGADVCANATREVRR